MKSFEVKEFERFLQESFEGDVRERELRLSPEEREFVENRYPGALMSIISSKECRDGKTWYEVRI